MKITVRLFAAARELVGDGCFEQRLEPGATVRDLANLLFEQYPDLRDMRLQFAVNATYASLDTALHDGDRVACIPPVGGG
jgi:MoaD family protein